MDDGAHKSSNRKWPYTILAVLLVLGVAFGAGMWFADQGERAVGDVTESYSAAYEGLDTTKDVPGLVPLYAADAVFRDVATDRDYQGASEIESALNALLATPGFDLTVERTLLGDDWALVFWTADGTRPDSGQVTQVSGVTSLEIAKGKITRETWYYDPAKASF